MGTGFCISAPARVGGKEGQGGRRPACPSLPCLYSNNCNEEGEEEARKLAGAKWQRLSSVHRKTAHALTVTIRQLAAIYGIERLGFLTLTFADHVIDMREASRRFHSLTTGVLNERYSDWVRVAERQRSGRIHYHLVCVLAEDIRTGADFKAFEKGDYRSANAALRAEWAFWRATAKKYRFGRTELLPVKSTAEGIARYVGKYISKHIGQREERDKGVRLVAYKRGTARGSTRFTWATLGADLWRLKLAAFCKALGFTADDYRQKLQEGWGSNWAYLLVPIIKSIRLEVYPTGKQLAVDYPDYATVEQFPGIETAVEVTMNGGQDYERSLSAAVAVALFRKAPRQLETFPVHVAVALLLVKQFRTSAGQNQPPSHRAKRLGLISLCIKKSG